MSVGQLRPAPPPASLIEQESEAWERLARRIWTGRGGQEMSEDEAIRDIVTVQYPNMRPELRGAHRADAKAIISFLAEAHVIVLVEPGLGGDARYRWSESFPEFPKRSVADVEARTAESRQQAADAALDRQHENRREEHRRHNPRDAEIEDRLTAVEQRQATEIAELKARNNALEDELDELRNRHRDGAATTARLDQGLASKAAREGRVQGSPASTGEEGSTDGEATEF